MVKKYAQLESIHCDVPITAEDHCDFLNTLQRAMLLALKECETLNEMQYRHAESKLESQKRNYKKTKGKEA